MIYGQETPTSISALDFIKNSSSIFTLTGSRYFGTSTEASDWDYFTDYNSDVIKELSAAGFCLETESYQGDQVIVQVWKRDNVHVQLVQSSVIKRYVQWQLISVFLEMKPTKEQAKLLWSVAIRLYMGGMEYERIRERK